MLLSIEFVHLMWLPLTTLYIYNVRTMVRMTIMQHHNTLTLTVTIPHKHVTHISYPFNHYEVVTQSNLIGGILTWLRNMKNITPLLIDKVVARENHPLS